MAANATDVYITLEEEGTVTRITRQGGKTQGLWSQQAAPAAIALDAKNVYWVNKGSGNKPGAIMKLPLGSTEPVTLATGEPNPQDLAIDGTSVYWTNLSGSIKKAPIAGGEVVTLAAGTTMVNVHGIAVDSTNVYWTVVGEAVGLNAGSVMTVPSKGGASTVVLDRRNLTEGSIALLGNWVYFVELNAPDTGLITVEKAGGSAYYVRKVDMNLPAPLTSDSTYVYLGTRVGILRFKAGDGSSKTMSGSAATSIAVDDTSILWTTESGSLEMVPKP